MLASADSPASTSKLPEAGVGCCHGAQQSWLCGMICFASLVLDHERIAAPAPELWKYSSLIAVRCPAVSAMVPLCSAPVFVYWSMMSFPFTHSRAPSSVFV
jgi:hypothetical protein